MVTHIPEFQPIDVAERPADYFKPGDRVVCFLGDFPDILPEKVFTYVRGMVVAAPRKHDDSVVVICEEPIRHSGKLELNFRTQQPCIIPEEDYLLLKAFYGTNKSKNQAFEKWVMNSPLECNPIILNKMIENF